MWNCKRNTVSVYPITNQDPRTLCVHAIVPVEATEYKIQFSSIGPKGTIAQWLKHLVTFYISGGAWVQILFCLTVAFFLHVPATSAGLHSPQLCLYTEFFPKFT